LNRMPGQGEQRCLKNFIECQDIAAVDPDQC
jgi:hypothetical protein